MEKTNAQHHRASAHLHRRAGLFHATSAAASVAAVLGIIQGNSEQRVAAAWRRIAITSAVVGLGATIAAYALGRAAREASDRESAGDRVQSETMSEPSKWAGQVLERSAARSEVRR